jgi:hypothetical protein
VKLRILVPLPEAGKSAAGWELAVATACQATVHKEGPYWAMHTGPVTVDATIYLPRAKADKADQHIKTPDLIACLLIGIERGLENIAIKRGEQIVTVSAHKQYCPASRAPGAVIEVST